jgi:hypothetical protein
MEDYDEYEKEWEKAIDLDDEEEQEDEDWENFLD